MDWRRTWLVGMYGSTNPSRARRAAMRWIVISTLIAAYGASTEFVPAALTADIGDYLSGAVTLLVSGFVWHGYWTGRIPWGVRPRSWVARLLSMAFVPMFIFGVSWLVVVRAIPDLATRTFGTEASKAMHAEASYRSRRRSCDHQLRSDAIPFPGYICISPSEFSRLAPGGEVNIIGKTTILGIHVEKVESAR